MFSVRIGISFLPFYATRLIPVRLCPNNNHSATIKIGHNLYSSIRSTGIYRVCNLLSLIHVHALIVFNGRIIKRIYSPIPIILFTSMQIIDATILCFFLNLIR